MKGKQIFRSGRRLAAVGLAAVLMASVIPTGILPAAAEEEKPVRARMGLSYTYPQTYDDWENGFMSGNGKMGVIVFGNPLDETVIYNHRLFFIAATKDRSFNTVSEELLTKIRKACASGDFKTANDLANEAHGWQDGGEGNKHPGYEMKITIPSDGEIKNYTRTCNYSTGEVIVSWSDSRGDWSRETFVSRQDNVVVQRLQKPSEGKLTCSVTLGTDAGMNFPGGMSFQNMSSEEYLNMRAKYPSGTNGAGYEGVTRVIPKGGTVSLNGDVLTVTDADELLLLTRADKYYSDCETEWNKQQLQSDLSKISDNYDTLLAGQKATHGEIYDRVLLDLGASDMERAKANETLLAEQKNAIELQPALYERLFDAGRYHYLCSSSEIGSPDLLGIWTGDCSVGWSGYYHLDANLNLQISGAIIGNMLETMEGYFYLNEAWADDFKINAQKLLGCRGMLAGGNTPGATSGLISSLNYYYPYQYVTGEESWLLYPFWEYYQVTGDKDFLRNRLYPLLREMGDFYEDFLQETDENGNYIFAGSISPENQPAGLGLSLVNNSTFDISSARFALEKLCEICDMFDLEQGADGGVARWQAILDKLPPYRINEDGALAEWAWDGLKDSYGHRHSSGLIGVWPYREITPEDTPELFEAASVMLGKKDQSSYENAGHGLLHAALIAANLKNATSVTQKLARFGKEDWYFAGLTTSHYPNYNVFCTDVCNTLPTILMESLLCSDEDSLEFLPALPDSFSKGSVSGLLGRNRVTVDELSWDLSQSQLTCTLTSAVDQTITIVERQGITGVKTAAETGAVSEDKTSFTITLEAGKSTDVTLQLVKVAQVENLALNATATASSFKKNDPERVPAKSIDGDYTSRWSSEYVDDAWIQLDLGKRYNVRNVKLFWEASYAKRYELAISDDGEDWLVVKNQDNGKGGTENIPVDAYARYVKLSGIERVEIGGTRYGYSLYEFEVYGSEIEEPVEEGLPGDVNGDEKVDTTDARLALQHAVGKIELDAEQQARADVSGDGKVDTTDARLILQKAVGKIDQFPVEN